LVVPLTVEYHTLVPETGELHQGRGILRDISLSGSYFHMEQPVTLKPGQILSLTIAAPLPYLDMPDTTHLKARGEVVRLDPPGSGPHHGVAVNFVNGLSLSAP
jgi:hypothetical protein